MEKDDISNRCGVRTSDDIDSRCAAVNSLILDYYKKFGRKRDLEQYFSLSTAQSDIKDTSGTFWRKMKSENDSSDSGGRKSDSSHEVCRISIRCSLPEPCSSQDDDTKTKTESPQTESPPIIIEEMPADVTRHTDDESINFDDNNSQKSFDALLDLSSHKPLSPTSSITSQRKLEWDSLADVGYANESDRKNSASSLSTLERLALKQQYSNNDSKDIGHPTSHSTPCDDDNKSKKKGVGKKTTKIYKKDVDVVEVNVPHTSDSNQAPSINVNLTKHISFNVEKDGGITIENLKKDLNVSPEKVAIEPATSSMAPLGMDKEIQTTLIKQKSSQEKSTSCEAESKSDPNSQKIPVMISLNTLRKRLRRKKSRVLRKRKRTKNSVAKDVTPQEKSGEQLSEAESFEYMPGHMYNQNQMKENARPDNNSTADNKSSLESSAPNTDSSKGSKHSLTKDLEKCIDVLKLSLQQRYDDGAAKKQLIRDIVRRLVNSRYRDDDSTTEFLSGLSFSSQKLDLKGNNTTSSTSDANNTEEDKDKRPRKSILRTEKFNANAVASTSQSAPNLFTASSEKVNPKSQSSHTDSDASKAPSDIVFTKTSSEELYLKYLEALRREEAYKRHLKDKEMFLKQKLACSDTAFKVPLRSESKISSRLKDLMKDLTRNNYDDGSGDASKLEGGSSSNIDIDRLNVLRSQRSQSVFTLSSSQSEGTKKPNLKKKMQAEKELGEAGPSRNHYCCCPHHYSDAKVGFADSSVQVNIRYSEGEPERSCLKPKPCEVVQNDCRKCKSPRNTARVVNDDVTGEIKYVCMCSGRPVSTSDVGDNFMIYKCSKLKNRGVQLEEPKRINNTAIQCRHMGTKYSREDDLELIQGPLKVDSSTPSSSSGNTSKKYSKSSQADMLINMTQLGEFSDYMVDQEPKPLKGTSTRVICQGPSKKKVTVNEATRWLQTEISIDPRISDPTLSDISIVNECNCAKLVSEQVRQVSATPSEKSDNGNSQSLSEDYNAILSDNAAQSAPSSGSNASKERENRKMHEDIARKEQERNENNALKERDGRTCCTNKAGLKEGPSNENRLTLGRNYAVPIDGTDMTLMVNLGTAQLNTKDKVDQGVGTERLKIAEEGTCIIQECTKSAQCCPHFVDQNSNDLVAKLTSSGLNTPRLNMNTIKGLRKIANSNTYPKNEPVKQKPPFKRSMTDTACCTEPINLKDDGIEAQEELISKIDLAVEPKTSEFGCQAETIQEVDSTPLEEEVTKTFVALAPKPSWTKLITPILRDVAVQKDVEDERPNLPVKSRIDEGTSPSKDTATETKKQGQSTGCQTDVQETKTNLPPGRQTDGQEMKNKLPRGRQMDGQEMKSKLPAGRQTDGQEMITKLAPCQSDGQEVKTKLPTNWTAVRAVPVEISGRSGMQSENENFEEREGIKSRSDSEKKDPIVDLIQDITRRYSKEDVGKFNKKKCFNDIMAVLNYLLDTEDSTDMEPKACCSSSTETKSSSFSKKSKPKSSGEEGSEKLVDKSVQLSCRKSSKHSKVATESSDLPCSSDLPTTSTDSAACKVLKKIRKECEKYHQRRCKSGRKCEVSSSTSINCEKCKKVHHCQCKNHKCKRSKTFEKLQKKCIAYNLIIQTSESMLSEETVCDENKICRPLKNIIVKVPKRKEMKQECVCPRNSPRSPKFCKRSKSCPNESESTDDFIRHTQQATVREYLEQNRPDFVAKTTQRQHCLKFVRQRRASERATHRDLLSLHVEQQPDLTNLSSDELRQLAQQIGLDLRRRRPAPKFISEREMKKHSEKIYKTLPEVVQKKEEKKKENIKKTNLLMANIFKKNLQKHALRGTVSLSNYSTVIKI